MVILRETRKRDLDMSAQEPIATLIKTPDGVELDFSIAYPESKPAKAMVVLAHAMMVDRRTFQKSGFITTLLEQGYAVTFFNFRGRGASTLRDWSYADLVNFDVPTVLDIVRQQRRLPLFWLGHSLGGHVGLAALGKGLLQDFDGMLLVSTNVWLPSLETSFARRLKKSLTMFVIRLFVGLMGRLPVKASGFGTVDEANTYLIEMLDWWKHDQWVDRHTRQDYFSGSTDTEMPMLFVVGKNDTLNAHPQAVREFCRRFTPRSVWFWVVGREWTDGRAPANHMSLITSKHAHPGWKKMCTWINERLSEKET